MAARNRSEGSGETGAAVGGEADDRRSTAPASPEPPSLVLPYGLISPDLPVRDAEDDEDALVFDDGEWFLHLKPLPRFPLTSYAGAFLVGPDEEWCRQAVAEARKTWCPNSRRFLASITTRRSFAVPCLSWSCEVCQKRKWYAARELYRRGIEAAWERGDKVRFVTLTDGRGNMTVPELGAAWDDLAKALRRGGFAPARPKKPTDPAKHAAWRKRYDAWLKTCKRRSSLLDQYATVVEFGAEGSRQIHLHVLMTGDFIPYKKLSIWAKRCGFGEIAHITLVSQGDANEVGGYAGKLASYTAKAIRHGEEMHLRGAVRLRPVRSSRKWLADGLTGVERDLGIRSKGLSTDRGPWAMIEIDSKGQPRWTRTVGSAAALDEAP